MDKEILKMIEDYGTDDDFWGKPPEKMIENVEKTMKIRFPIEYREFISEFGAGGICGEYIEGIQGDSASVINATEKWRNLGLPENAFVVLDVGEYAMCMKTDDDSKVYSWTRGSEVLDQERYDTFYDFVKDYFQEAIDNY